MCRHLRFLTLMAACGCAALAHAQSVTYRCVDPGGRSTYTNVKEEMSGKKCTVVSREVSVVPAQQFPVPGPRGERAEKGEKAPPKPGERVDTNTQRSRDDTRRTILQEELDSAEKRLADARQKLADQESTRTSQERVAPQLANERLRSFREEVERQEQNVGSLKRELSNIR